jgi:hypothetical protein
MTLVKLRTHLTNYELGIFFDINERQVSNVFITWINFMFVQWSEINWWPSRQLISFFAPKDFYHKFPKTRLVFDCTEVPITKPTQPVAQYDTFSSYKNRNTVKVLVSISPGGLVTHVSQAYGGSTSDRQIVERSGLLAMCDPGDEVMGDKGFNVDDLFGPYKVTMNIPKFFKKKNCMSGATVIRDRKVSS